MADRVGVINKGELILVENKTELMRKLGRKQLTLELREPLAAVPPALARHALTLADAGRKLVYSYDTGSGQTGITELIEDLHLAGLRIKDLHTTETSLEDIFVGLLRKDR